MGVRDWQSLAHLSLLRGRTAGRGCLGYMCSAWRGLLDKSQSSQRPCISGEDPVNDSPSRPMSQPSTAAIRTTEEVSRHGLEASFLEVLICSEERGKCSCQLGLCSPLLFRADEATQVIDSNRTISPRRPSTRVPVADLIKQDQHLCDSGSCRSLGKIAVKMLTLGGSPGCRQVAGAGVSKCPILRPVKL